MTGRLVNDALGRKRSDLFGLISVYLLGGLRKTTRTISLADISADIRTLLLPGNAAETVNL
jgi:hypothetical protein